MAKPKLTLMDGFSGPQPPAHLDAPEATLWREITKVHRFDEAASQAILMTALEAHQRYRLAREQIEDHGATVTDRWGQVKPHPLLPVERDARAAFLSAMRLLGLDLVGTK